MDKYPKNTCTCIEIDLLPVKKVIKLFMIVWLENMIQPRSSS